MNTNIRVLLLDTFKETRNFYITKAIESALSSIVEKVTLTNYKDAISDYYKYNCNVFLAFGGAGGEDYIVSTLAKNAKCSVLWTTEDPYELKNNVKLSKYFDLVFTNDRASLTSYGRNTKHLPLAGIDSGLGNKNKKYDVLFIGTAWPNRVEVINKIIDNFKDDIKLKIALPTNQYLPKFKLNDDNISYDWRVSNDDFLKLSDQSKITLGIDRKFTSSEGGVESGSTPPPRIFEVAARGNFQLTPYNSSEIKNYYSDDELLVYKSHTDLLDKISYFLKNDKEREEIANRSRNKTINHHLYKNRLKLIVDEVGVILETKLNSSDAKIEATNKKNVLMVTHNYSGLRPGGGVEVYQDAIEFENYRKVFLFPLSPGEWKVQVGNFEKVYAVPDCDAKHALYDPKAELVFQGILNEFNISIVHFQHLLGFPLSLPLISKSLGYRTIYTAHDYYLVCSRFNLIDYRNEYCNFINSSSTKCQLCSQSSGYKKGAEITRRNFVENVISAFDRIIFNSPYTEEYIRESFVAFEPEQAEIIEMITPFQFFEKDKPGDENTNVAIIGNYTEEKGKSDYVRIFNNIRNSNVTFHVFGRVEESDINLINNLNIENVKFHGAYNNSQLSKLINGFDISLHLSKWPETYMITLNEAMSCGLIPIIYDLGAPAERVVDGENGFVVPYRSVEDVISIINEIHFNKPKKDKLKSKAEQIKCIDKFTHSSLLEKLYNKLEREYDRRTEYSSKVTTLDLGIRTNKSHWHHFGLDMDHSLSTLELESDADNLSDLVDIYSCSLEADAYNIDSISDSNHVLGWIIPSFEANNIINGVYFISKDKKNSYKAEVSFRDDVSKKFKLEKNKFGFSVCLPVDTSIDDFVILASTDIGFFASKIDNVEIEKTEMDTTYVMKDISIDYNLENFNFLIVNNKECQIDFSGWIADSRLDLNISEILLVIKSVSGDEHFIPVIRSHRQDIVEHFNDSIFLMSGVKGMSTLSLEEGKYNVFAYCIDHLNNCYSSIDFHVEFEVLYGK
ncbi:TPA: glycosyltransferase [Vibrio parahaemolyticus]|nr:glycosyltransferase [Vibrio parahaemolyticus]HCM1219919.1 glycosyltransferase [Vibrio parahaemolyticus]